MPQCKTPEQNITVSLRQVNLRLDGINRLANDIKITR